MIKPSTLRIKHEAFILKSSALNFEASILDRKNKTLINLKP